MEKLFGLLGLAKRAGRLVCGESGVKESVRYGKSYLVIIAGDASDNTKKNITDSCRYYDVPYYILSTKEELGHTVGNNFNAALSVNDKGFSESMSKYLHSDINGGD